jgi:hypothetical protein
MKPVIAILLVQLVLLLPAFAAGNDEATGKIIWSVATNNDADIFEMFAFQFRSRDGKHSDYASYSHDSLLSRGSDFVGENEKGGVQILTVPAGEWEMYQCAMTGRSSALDSTTFYPSKDFSVPITIIPGGTVYIGSYRAVWTAGKDAFGAAVTTGGYFAVSDQSGRDIAIAKKKDSAIGDVDAQIPDYGALGLPFFQPVPVLNAPKIPIGLRIPMSALRP